MAKKMNWIRGLTLVSIIIWTPTMVQAWSSEDIFSHFQAYITVQEEYNSNIDLTATHKRNDYITTVSPGLRFSTSPKSATTGEFQRAPTAEDRFGIDLDFNAGFVFYAKEHDDNYISLNGTLNAWYAFTKNLTFRIRDYLIRSDEIREADYSTTALPGQNLLSRTNKREPYYRNVFEPSMEYRFGRENLIVLNYRNSIYEINSRTSEDSMENYINPRLTYWFNIRHGVIFEYGLTLGDFQRSPDLVGHMAMGRYIYRFNPRTSIFGEYTYLNRNLDPPSIDYDVHRSSLGIEHAFSQTLSGRAQFGYFWQNPERGSTTNGLFYDVSLSQRAERTTYRVSFQGGYTEDFFTSENLGFTKYHRAIGAISHRLLEKMMIGFRSSFERARYGEEATDRIWEVGCNGSYEIFRRLTLSLDVSHRENHSNISNRDYSEYRGMFRVIARY